MKVFLDTNVILDVLAGRQPFFPDSQRVMTFCERNSGTGMASVLTFCTVAYVLRKSLGKPVTSLAIAPVSKALKRQTDMDCFRCWEFWSLGGLEDFHDLLRNS